MLSMLLQLFSYVGVLALHKSIFPQGERQSILIWPLSFDLSSIGDLTRNLKSAGIIHKIFEAHHTASQSVLSNLSFTLSLAKLGQIELHFFLSVRSRVASCVSLLVERSTGLNACKNVASPKHIQGPSDGDGVRLVDSLNLRHKITKCTFVPSVIEPSNVTIEK